MLCDVINHTSLFGRVWQFDGCQVNVTCLSTLCQLPTVKFDGAGIMVRGCFSGVPLTYSEGKS